MQPRNATGVLQVVPWYIPAGVCGNVLTFLSKTGLELLFSPEVVQDTPQIYWAIFEFGFSSFSLWAITGWLEIVNITQDQMALFLLVLGCQMVFMP